MRFSEDSQNNMDNLNKKLLSSSNMFSSNQNGRKDPNKLSLDESKYILGNDDDNNNSIQSVTPITTTKSKRRRNSSNASGNKYSAKLSYDDNNVIIKSLNEDEIDANLCSDREPSVVTLNAEPITNASMLSGGGGSLRDISSVLLGEEALKRMRKRKSLKNPSIDSSHLQIWYGSQVIRKRSLDDSILQMIQMEASDLPILKENLMAIICLSFSMCLLLGILYLCVFMWYFMRSKYINTPWGAFTHYSVLLVSYGIFNGLFNKISYRIDGLRQYIYDISIQLLMELFVNSLYWLLYRYSLLLIMPLMTNGEKHWFHENGFFVILLHVIFQIILPGFFFASETFYDLCTNDSIPWIFRKILLIFNIYDDDDIIQEYNDWRERYSLIMIMQMICCTYSFLAIFGFIIFVYSFGNDGNNIDNMHDIQEGTLYVLLSLILEIVFFMSINYKIFDGGMIEPFLRLYELNPVRLLLSIGVVLAATHNQFGQTLFQETLAGYHDAR